MRKLTTEAEAALSKMRWRSARPRISEERVPMSPAMEEVPEPDSLGG